ncbi:MAG TPA: NADPH:quinone oxidoreductase family protein [Candidatus Kryptonia bacterium]|nr:NADPH:quinone oxidoreductase family protein [Candidatus Kryptonia bacterium]
MRAVQIHRFGDDSVLRYEEVPDLTPGPDEVRVAVKAASINRGDLARRHGNYPGEVAFPFTLGFEVAGVIDAVGAGIAAARIGERVVAVATHGGYAEQLVTPAIAALPLPDSVSDDAGASIPVVFLAAWYGLVITANVRPDEWVLVQAGASGVGLAAIQIAKHRGARVIATASSQDKLEFARRHGADATINYDEQDFVAEAWRITDGAGVDIVYESVGGEIFEASLEVLRLNGRLICIGNTVGKTATVDPTALFRSNLSVHGLYLVPWVLTGDAWPVLGDIIQLVANGTLRVAVDRRYPLRDAAMAHRYLEQRKNFGKVVLHP